MPTIKNNNNLNHVYPMVNEINQDVKCNILCTQEGCGKILPHSSALMLHLIKVHKIIQSERDAAIFHKKQNTNHDVFAYHCPVEECNYNNESKYFAHFRYLKQHYMSCHGDKKYKCSKCNAGFGLQRNMAKHEKNCGIFYSCSQCKVSFTTKISLMKHCERASHDFPYAEYGPPLQKKVSKCNSKWTPKEETEKLNQQESIKNGFTSEPTNILLSRNSSIPFILPKPTTVIMPLQINVIIKNQAQQVSSESSNIVLVSDSHPITSKFSTQVKKHRQILPKTSESDFIANQSHSINISNENSSNVDTGTQTALHNMFEKSAAYTQTAEISILQKAMIEADVECFKESRASQVSPQGKLKNLPETYQSCETQTISTRTPKSVNEKVNVFNQTAAIFENNLFSCSHNETQTQNLDCNIRFGESTSTQTFESFLAKEFIEYNNLISAECDSIKQSFNSYTNDVDNQFDNLDSIVQNTDVNSDLICVSSNSATDISSSVVSVNFINQKTLNFPDNMDSNDTETSSVKPYAVNSKQQTDSFASILNSNYDSSDCFDFLNKGEENFKTCPDLENNLFSSKSQEYHFLAHELLPPTKVNTHILDNENSKSNTVNSSQDVTQAIGIQTDNFDIGDSVDLFRGNMETQTINGMFEQYFNNMQTQTNDGFDGFDFLYDEKQTQCHLDFLYDEKQTQCHLDLESINFNNVETQTTLHPISLYQSSVELMDIETQTLFDPDLNWSFIY